MAPLLMVRIHSIVKDLEFSSNKIWTELAEVVWTLTSEIIFFLGNQIIRSFIVWSFLGTHEESVVVLWSKGEGEREGGGGERGVTLR
jgi:hypothetical protein